MATEAAVFCLDKKQHGVGELRKTIELTYTDDRLAQVRATGVTVSLTVPVTALPDSLKLVVYDYPDDLTGSLNVQMKR